MSEHQAPHAAGGEAESRSASTLVGDLVTHVSELFRKEIQLLRAEMNEKSSQVVTAIGLIVAGVIVALTALNVLAAALVGALENAGLDAAWAALLVGIAFGIVAFVLTSRGTSNLKASSLAPQRTVAAASRDAAMVREKM